MLHSRFVVPGRLNAHVAFTDRHGGYHLTPEVNLRIPAEVRQVDGFYEQDVQGALCAYFVPFDSADRTDVLVMIETRYPEIYARIVRGEL